jgi:hypothetical protein
MKRVAAREYIIYLCIFIVSGERCDETQCGEWKRADYMLLSATFYSLPVFTGWGENG